MAALCVHIDGVQAADQPGHCSNTSSGTATECSVAATPAQTIPAAAPEVRYNAQFLALNIHPVVAEDRIQGAFAVLRRDVPMASAPTAPAPATKADPPPAKTAPATAKTDDPPVLRPSSIPTATPKKQRPVAVADAAAAPTHPVQVGRSVATVPAAEPRHQAGETRHQNASFFDICSKFKTYDARTGTYHAYDGKVKRCAPTRTVTVLHPAAKPRPAPAAPSHSGGGVFGFLAAHAVQPGAPKAQ
jgi:hypothetical protein